MGHLLVRSKEGQDKLLFRLPGALARAALVILLIALPSMLLPGGSTDGLQIVAIVAIFAALFTVVEYSAASPSLVEFRDAPPFNRVRFSTLFATVFSLSVICRGFVEPSAMTMFFENSSAGLGQLIDFPLSPVHLMVAILPDDASLQAADRVKNAAGLSYVMSLFSIIWFIVLLRLQNWPRRGGAFNVWINLPTFDPTAGGDVVKRLRRDGHLNIFLGLLMPFLIPLVIKMTAFLGAPLRLDDPQTLIWTVTAWTFLPAGILMRGIALTRVAKMIEQQRKRAHDRAAANGLLPA